MGRRTSHCPPVEDASANSPEQAGPKRLHRRAKAREARAVDRFVGARIRERRRELGMTQAALAKLLGVAYQQVQKYEHGQDRVSAGMLFELALALRLRLDAFFPRLPRPAQGPAVTDDVAEIARLYRRIGSAESRRSVMEMLAAMCGTAP